MILTTKCSKAPQSVNKSKRQDKMRYNDEEYNRAFPYCAAINPLPAAAHGVVQKGTKENVFSVSGHGIM